MILGLVTPAVAIAKDSALATLASHYDHGFEERYDDGEGHCRSEAYRHIDKNAVFLVDVPEDQVQAFLSEAQTLEDCFQIFDNRHNQGHTADSNLMTQIRADQKAGNFESVTDEFEKRVKGAVLYTDGLHFSGLPIDSYWGGSFKLEEPQGAPAP